MPVFAEFVQGHIEETSSRKPETEKIFTAAEVEVVAVNSEGKIYRRMPDILRIACEKGMAD